jgi:hypothetical protein
MPLRYLKRRLSPLSKDAAEAKQSAPPTIPAKEDATMANQDSNTATPSLLLHTTLATAISLSS